MASRAVLHIFEDYQASRTKFVQTVAELAMRSQNMEALQNAGAMALLRPLLLDTVPSIQQVKAVVSNEVLPQLVHSLSEQNVNFLCYFCLLFDGTNVLLLIKKRPFFKKQRYHKKAAAFVTRSVAKHTPELAQKVVDAGALEPLVKCLSDASALSEISKHNNELAQAVVNSGVVTYLTSLVQHPDSKLKRQACSALAQIAKHSADLAEVIVEAEIFPKIFTCLKDLDVIVRKNAATLIREIAKHTLELASLIVNASGHAVLVEFVTENTGNTRLPGIMALGYIGAFSDTLALAIIVNQGIAPLKEALSNEEEDYIKAAASWSLGQIGRHTPDHSKALAQAGVFRILIDIFQNEQSSQDLKTKAQKAFKATVQKCTYLPALELLLHVINFICLIFSYKNFVYILLGNRQFMYKSFFNHTFFIEKR
ncbi:axoneme central apparatus protein [Reticulomyxa filosa]|uniref:Axoneme central apparatus protein n=1 Tax=Reticulomyxa filosa TaxID=46433 RepID=X6NNQ8_RETFI|nr:axoneme central apparatus protein [Reticulomyxa filosa]|eukprot:ETO27344.1 axoneme central apparatus protein [Reticulomyxa filosa]